MKYFKTFLLYFLFPAVIIGRRLLEDSTLSFFQKLILFSIALGINFLFMKFIGVRLFTYKGKNKNE
ncbi:hypothetical protein LPB144_10960 [Christiangramia salexigens]|uniref:Uncharacterized protein n=1 Tax=Christiangramia salexigens TaxID=1913577 RepID=A0A1L3J6X8_9FLAO|nr:hypothetical protein LPB144_10960 [Christiangramia salexigens]